MSILKFPALIINESLYIKQVMNNIINQCMKVVWSNCLLQLFLTKRFKICFGYHISYIISNVKKMFLIIFFLIDLSWLKLKFIKHDIIKKKVSQSITGFPFLVYFSCTCIMWNWMVCTDVPYILALFYNLRQSLC